MDWKLPPRTVVSLHDRIGQLSWRDFHPPDCSLIGRYLQRFREPPQNIINFATALGALKHTIRGDACFVNEEDVWGMIQSKGEGSVIR